MPEKDDLKPMINADSPPKMPRWRDPKTGVPLTPEYVMEAVVRLDMKLQPQRHSGQCWLFLGGWIDGYGAFRVGSTQLPTHRVVAALSLGVDIHDLNGVHVRHNCHNRACCNPDHLYLWDRGSGTRVACTPAPRPINEKRPNRSSQYSATAVSDPVAQLLEARMTGLQAELSQLGEALSVQRRSFGVRK